jgi:ATP-dependent Clp protease adapter protein ClpS
MAKPTKKQLSAAGKALQNPHTREVNETKAAKVLAAGRHNKNKKKS